jgi:predicted membrane-bound spermidine synthase
MSTTTGPKTSSVEVQVSKEVVPASSGQSRQGWLLILMVFVAGAVSLSIEIAASRLLTPYFGSTQLVWATIIGLILLYLTVGYYVGGLLSDCYPRPHMLYSITTIAAFFIILIPFIGGPILHWAQVTFSADTTGVFYGSLCAVIALFAIPTILLGCVSPYAIRLRVIQIGKAGHVAGMLYAISTAGSILGTFLPVLVLLPDLGTKQTFIVSGVILLLCSIIGLLVKEHPVYPL